MSGTSKEAVAASVNDRLRAAAKRLGGDQNAATQFVHARYVYERMMARLPYTSVAGRWAIKGGVLMLALDADVHRMTMDMDFSVRQGPSPRVTDVIRELCAVTESPEDGMSYSLVTDGKDAPRLIREESEQPTARLKLIATLHCPRPAERRFVVDITGSELPFEPVMRQWEPTIRGFDPLVVPACPWELVLAEKLHSVLTGTIANPRLRDYMDVIAIARSGVADAATAAQWIGQVFEVRGDVGKQHESAPVGLSEVFAETRQRDWTGTLARTGFGGSMPVTLSEASQELRSVVSAILDGPAACPTLR